MPFFNYAMNTEVGNLVCETLQYPGRSSKTSAVKLDDKYKTDSPFDPLMTNLCKEIVGLKDLVMEKWETEGDFKGHQLQYASGTDGFDSIGEITVSFEDTTMSPMFLKHFLWFPYITEVCKGTINPRMAYIRERVIDYTCSMYGFKLAEDNTTILRFWKLTGCFPISVPMNTLGHTRDMKLDEFDDIQITYAYNMYEPMNPNTIRDFNALSMRHAFTKDSGSSNTGGEGNYPPFTSDSDKYNMVGHKSPIQLIETKKVLRNSQAKSASDTDGVVSLWSTTPIIVGNKLVWV
jgi:hypothetical protein